MIRLRGHHLLCVLTYEGQGYSADFIRSFDAIVRRLNAGEPAVVVDGPDDICMPLLDTDPLDAKPSHCRAPGAADRDRRAAGSIGELLGRPIAAGVSLALGGASLRAMRAAFQDGSLRSACRGCEWNDLCTRVARDFSRSRFGDAPTARSLRRGEDRALRSDPPRRW